jgi:hypothetical protein
VLRGAKEFLAAASNPGFRVTIEIAENLYSNQVGSVDVVQLMTDAGLVLSGTTLEGDGIWVFNQTRSVL